MDAYHFPTEILHQICEQINDSRDLKALRLVSHRFASVSESILFRIIRLYYHSARWTALNNIADNPRLARYVECIEIENGEDEYACDQGSDSWKRRGSDKWAWQNAYDSLILCPRHNIGSTVQQTLDAIASFSYPPRDSFRMAKRWQDDGRYVMNTGGSPSLNLWKLPRLSKVETVHRADFKLVLTYRDPNGRHANTNRESLETRLHPSVDIRNNHLKVMMRAISDCGISLTRLSLHATAEIYDLAHQSLSGFVSAVLPNLLHLSITPPAEGPARKQDFWANHRSQFPINIWSTSPASWLFSLRNLHTFEVLEGSCEEMINLDYGFSVFSQLRDVHWPSLRTVRLKHIQSKVSDLRHFLLVTNRDRFQHLDELTITEPRMAKGQWNRLRAELQKTVPGPARLELTPIMVEKPSSVGMCRCVQCDHCC